MPSRVRNRSSSRTLDGTSLLVLIQAATDSVPRGWTSGCWLPIAAAMSRMAASSRASVLRPSSWVSSQAIGGDVHARSSWRSRRLATSMSMGCPDRMVLIVSAWAGGGAAQPAFTLGGVHIIDQAQRGVDVGEHPC